MPHADESSVLLDEAAGDFTAGDLTPEQSMAFSERLLAEPRLGREVDFWRNLRSGLNPAATVPAGPGPGFARALLIRHQREAAANHVVPVVPALIPTSSPAPAADESAATRPIPLVLVPSAPAKRIPFPAPAWTAAAAAACLGLAIGWWGASSQPHGADAGTTLAYAEDGAQLRSPDRARSLNVAYLPRSGQDDVDIGHPATASSASTCWIGLWTKPVDLEQDGAVTGRGQLVLRVAADGPAWRAGMRPGDVLLSFNGCLLPAADSLATLLRDSRPGAVAQVRYWSAATAEVVEKPVAVGAMCE
jgi:hypothetical protein